jgi:hypothetical protein
MNAYELADWITKEYAVMRHGKEYEIACLLRNQQAEIDRNCKYIRQKKQALKHEIADLKLKIQMLEKTTNTVMSEHCTCYKLGYSPLNDYASVKQK